jgi:hypothetical protein
MSRGKRIGVILILVGLCIPILAMLFASGYSSGRDFMWNVKNSGIVIWTEKKTEAPGPWQASHPLWIPTITYFVPCSVFFALGIVLVATGTGFMLLSRDQAK